MARVAILLVVVMGAIAADSTYSVVVERTRPPEPTTESTQLEWQLVSPSPSEPRARVATHRPGLVRVLTGDGGNFLYRYPADETDAVPKPTWSPDGGLLAFGFGYLIELTAIDTITGQVVTMTDAPGLYRGDDIVALDRDTVVYLSTPTSSGGSPRVVFWSPSSGTLDPVSLEPLSRDVSSIDVSDHVDVPADDAMVLFAYWDDGVVEAIVLDGTDLYLRSWPFASRDGLTSKMHGWFSFRHDNRRLTVLDVSYRSPFALVGDDFDELVPVGHCAQWNRVATLDLIDGTITDIELPGYRYGQNPIRNDWIVGFASYDLVGNLIVSAAPKTPVLCDHDFGWEQDLFMDLILTPSGDWLDGTGTDSFASVEMVDGSILDWWSQGNGTAIRFSDRSGSTVFDGTGRSPLDGTAGPVPIATWPNPALASGRMTSKPIDDPVEFAPPPGGSDRSTMCGDDDIPTRPSHRSDQDGFDIDLDDDGVPEYLITEYRNDDPFNLVTIYNLDPVDCAWEYLFGQNTEITDQGFDIDYTSRGELWCIGKDRSLYSFGNETIRLKYGSGYLDAIEWSSGADSPLWSVCATPSASDS